MATLSIASAKGGVGKTTVAIAVSAELALDGYRLASEWGAVTTVPSPKPVIASLRLEIPEYLDRQLAQAAFDQRVTKQFLVIQALKAAGFSVDAADLVPDKRKRR